MAPFVFFEIAQAVIMLELVIDILIIVELPGFYKKFDSCRFIALSLIVPVIMGSVFASWGFTDMDDEEIYFCNPTSCKRKPLLEQRSHVLECFSPSHHCRQELHQIPSHHQHLHHLHIRHINLHIPQEESTRIIRFLQDHETTSAISCDISELLVHHNTCLLCLHCCRCYWRRSSLCYQ